MIISQNSFQSTFSRKQYTSNEKIEIIPNIRHLNPIPRKKIKKEAKPSSHNIKLYHIAKKRRNITYRRTRKAKTIKICRYLLMRSSIFPAFLVDSEMIQTRLQLCLQYAEDIWPFGVLFLIWRQIINLSVYDTADGIKRKKLCFWVVDGLVYLVTHHVK